MKNLFNKYFNKYCDFIGVENEGYKRLLIISILLFPIIFPLSVGMNWEDVFSGLLFLKNYQSSLVFYLTIVLPSPIYFELCP
jgi:hypothetical protein